ncbi:MAG: Osmosensitive channel histidine kinaselike protein, partial [Frankiales bacterium]|nr:Osmosensitive channel histidine kinaselike protein [Frankiales bacterium]
VSRNTVGRREPVSPRTAMIIGLTVPPLVSAALVPLRRSWPGADLALVLVAAVVAVAALGQRRGGWSAAASAGISFDLLLIPPYGHFSIASRTDLTTLLLLVAVAAGVTELALWGRRQNVLATRQAGYLAGLHAASAAVAEGGSPTQLANRIALVITEILELKGCHFRFDSDPSAPCLQSDGTVRWGDVLWDVESDGFPLHHQTQLPVASAGRRYGRFLMTPNPGRPPALLPRLVAVSLAAQVGAALSDYQSGPV